MPDLRCSDSNLEQLITASNGGAIGLIGNSGKSYRGETENGSSYGNWWMNERFCQLFFNGTVQPGECLYKMKEDYVWDVIRTGVPYLRMAVANLVGYNLLGDPELSIWTDIPKKLNFTYSLIHDLNYKLAVNVTDEFGETIEKARVCIYKDDAYDYATTNSSGVAILDVDPRTKDKLEITITTHNFLPIFSDLTLKNQPPVLKPIPDVELNEDTVLEDHYLLKDYISDPDHELEDIVATIANVSNNLVGVRIDSYKQIDIRPFSNWFGESQVTVRIDDGFDYSERNFTIFVNPINDPPRIYTEIEDYEIEEGETFELLIEAFDIENDTLTFSDNSGLFNVDQTGKIKFKAKAKHAGSHDIEITVSDGTNDTIISFDLDIIGIPKEPSFIELYWFPLTVIVVATILIIGIKLYAIMHPESEEPEKKDTTKKIKKKGKGNY